MKSYITAFVKAMLLSYVLSAAVLFALSFLLYQFDIKEEQLRIGILGTYVLACLLGGFYIGKKIRRRQFLWGMCVGLMYYCIHIVMMLIAEGISPMQIIPATALALLCMGSGMMGGLLS